MASIFQKAYDFIKAIKTPAWLKQLLQELQDLMLDILISSGKAYIKQVEEYIVEAMGHADWNNDRKFKFVFDRSRNSGVQALIELRDHELDTLIQFLYSKLKREMD